MCVYMHVHSCASCIANKRQSATLSGNSCDTWTGCRHAGRVSCMSPVTNVYVKLSEHRETLRSKRTGEGGKRRKWSLCTFRHSTLVSVCLWLCSCVSASSILCFFPHINIYLFFLRSRCIASWQTVYMCMLAFNTNNTTGGQRGFTESSTWDGTRAVTVRDISQGYDKL